VIALTCTSEVIFKFSEMSCSDLHELIVWLLCTIMSLTANHRWLARSHAAILWRHVRRCRQKTQMYLVCWIRMSLSHWHKNEPPHQVALQSRKGPLCITKTTMDAVHDISHWRLNTIKQNVLGVIRQIRSEPLQRPAVNAKCGWQTIQQNLLVNSIESGW